MRRYCQSVALALCFSLFPMFAYAVDDPTKRAIQYINSLQDDCVVGDAYRCEPVSESTIKLNQQTMVPAKYLGAWPAVYVDFKSIELLSEAQKDFKHYKIGFAEDGDDFLVIFRALLLPEIDDAGDITGLLRTTFGQSMRYRVNKQTLQIVERKLYR